MQVAKEWRLAFFCLLIIVAHTVVSWFEEALFKRMQWNGAAFMIMYMCGMYSLMHAIAAPFVFKEHPKLMHLLQEARKKNLHTHMIMLCLAYAGSNSISKMALGFVSVPTQIVFKSCKLVAVMMGSSCILGKSYSWFEFGVAGGLVGGMICFAGGDFFHPGEEGALNVKTVIGVSILLCALCCDSVLGNLQEKVQKGGMCEETQLMYVQSIFGSIFLLILTGATGELEAGIRQCMDNINILWYLSAWSALNMFGIVLMLKVAGEFSAVVAVLTSSIRKLMSLVVSYLFFPKPLTYVHALGMGFVFGAIFMHTWFVTHQIPAYQMCQKAHQCLAVVLP